MILQILLAAAVIFVALGLWSLITMGSDHGPPASQGPHGRAPPEYCNECPSADICPAGFSSGDSEPEEHHDRIR